MASATPLRGGRARGLRTSRRIEGELSRSHNQRITSIKPDSGGAGSESARPRSSAWYRAPPTLPAAPSTRVGTGRRLELDRSLPVKARQRRRVDLGGHRKGYAATGGRALEEWDLERARERRISSASPRHGGSRLAMRERSPRASRSCAGSHAQVALSDRACARASTSGIRGWRGRSGGGGSLGDAAAAARQGPRAAEAGPRLAAGAVADALTTAFMLLPVEEIEALCQASPGLEAWILADGGSGDADLVHLTGPPPDRPASHSA